MFLIESHRRIFYSLSIFPLLCIYTNLPAQGKIYMRDIGSSHGFHSLHNAYLYTGQDGYFYASSSEGLYRFNGIETKNFRIATNDNLISSKVFEDANGRKWFSTGTGIHSIIEDSIKSWTVEQANPYISAFHMEQDSFLWFTADENIFVINVFEDFTCDGSLYPGQGFVNYPWTNNDGKVLGIIRPFFNKTRGVEVTKLDADRKLIQTDTVGAEYGEDIRYLEIEDDNTIWLPTNVGLVKLDPYTGISEGPYVHDSTAIDIQYTDIELYGTDSLLISSQNHGLLVFNKVLKVFENSTSHYFNGQGLSRLGPISHIYLDPYNNLWASELKKEFWQTNLNNQKFAELFPTSFLLGKTDFDVSDLIQTGQDSFLTIIDNQEIYRINKDSDGSYVISDISLPNLPTSEIKSLYQDYDKNLWIRTDKELLMATPNLNGIEYELNDQEVLDVIQVTGDSLVIITQSKVYPISKSHLPKELKGLKALELQGGYLEGGFYDSTSKSLLINYASSFLQVFTCDQGFSARKPLEGLGVISEICNDQDIPNLIWVASNAGLFKYYTDSNKYTKVLPDLDFFNQTFSGISKDKGGNLWLSTPNGFLHQFDPLSNEVISFNRADGIYVKSYRKGGVLQNVDDIVFYGKNGVTIIPRQLELNKNCPKVILEKILIKNKLVDKRAFYSSLEYPKFPAGSNDLSFEFAVIEFSDPQNNKLYGELLKGAKGKLVSTTSILNPKFPALSPGKYEFRVYPINSDDVSFPDATTSIYFKINKPWFLNNLAIAIYLICLIAIFFVALHLLDRRHRKKDEEEKRSLRYSVLESEQKLRLLDHHMISNLFGSITDGIAEKNINLAKWYSKQASRFYRNYLDISNNYAISISAEKIHIEEYIAMKEKLLDHRFKGSFKVDSSIDQEETLIPTFITQIFVENAIKHAFPADKKDGLLTVSIYKEKNFVVCEIEDNGVGRQKDQKQFISDREHISHGISFTKERLAIIQSQTQMATTLEITDLTDENDNATGTLVKIKYPADFDLYATT